MSSAQSWGMMSVPLSERQSENLLGCAMAGPLAGLSGRWLVDSTEWQTERTRARRLVLLLLAAVSQRSC
jgi:hypothetical protein